jgi:hypothetical protein
VVVKVTVKVVDKKEIVVMALVDLRDYRVTIFATTSTRASTCRSASKTASTSATLTSPTDDKSTTQNMVSRAYASSPASSGV